MSVKKSKLLFSNQFFHLGLVLVPAYWYSWDLTLSTLEPHFADVSPDVGHGERRTSEQDVSALPDDDYEGG